MFIPLKLNFWSGKSLNFETPMLGDLASATYRAVTIAHCSSRLCAGEFGMVEKSFNRSTDKCLDCGHYLYFETKKEDSR